ncbi:AfsR/SARP family transcriptional regulator [Actinomadura roseirufa]|uniref:AfsR/SARP family transcriptional regulator n=1 Tax=Actinomadura roseirufa TaxID=2094049 RepID=UPI0010412A8B|nr:BTAD domain-containing putative transcriptional regulator [Actinomadura roseirufa]
MYRTPHDGRDMTFAALGPLEVRKADRIVRLSGKQRAVLGMLLLNANAVVPRDRLVEGLWNEPPSSAVANVQTYVSGLRRVLLNGESGGSSRLRTQGHGYVLTADPVQLDLLEFTEAAERGRRQMARGDLAMAERELGHALSLWRGHPLEDVALSDLVAPRLAELAEQRMRAWTTWIDVRLSRSPADELIGELRTAAAAHPLREPIWEHLILALYRARRRGEALDCYQQARTILADELGIEPGPNLQRLHMAVLHDDSSLMRPLDERAGEEEGSDDHGATLGGWMRPAELPRDIRGFVGRAREQDLLGMSLPHDGATAPEPAGPNLWVVSGTAGVGKTALAVHWAHAAKDAFPDGQLHVDLYGFDRRRDPVEPAAALSQLLQSLGVPAAQVPGGSDEREKLYRSMIAGRRVLVVLDDARTAEQVRPLLPGHGEAVVLVTSRFRLGDLVVRHDARSLPLAALTTEDARELLAHAVGHERLATETEAADELACLCGHLPLALRIAAANITGGPDGAIAGMVAELNQGDRLAGLSVDGDAEESVAAAFRLSYDSLRPEHQKLFRLLGLIPGPTFTPPAVAALAGCSRSAAADRLKALAAAHLIDHDGGRVYRMHDLLRRYAADRADREERRKEQRRALTGLFTYYLNGVDAAGLTISPSTFRPRHGLPRRTSHAAMDLAEAGTALAWLQAELENIISVISFCLANGPLLFVWRIMDALRPFLSMGIYREEWLELGRQGLEAAERVGDRQAQATVHMSLGVAHLILGQLSLSERHLEQALESGTESGWLEGTAEASTHLSGVLLRNKNPGRAMQLARSAIDLYREHGHPSGEAAAHTILGYSHWLVGDLSQALRHQEQAHSLYLRTSSEYGQAICLTELAATLHDLGDLTGAAARYAMALAICERLKAPARQVQALVGLSRVQTEMGEHEAALRNAELAVELARRSRNRRAETSAFDALARACFALDRHDDARDGHRRALRAAEHVGVAVDIVQVLIGMTECRGPGSDREDFSATVLRAMAIAKEHGFRLFEGKAAEVLAKADESEIATARRRVAITAYERTGHRHGAERVRRLL